MNSDARARAPFGTSHDQAAREPDSPAAVAPRTTDAAIREWLLLLLRFAVTHDAKDEAATLAMADELDALGLQWRPSAPTFFRRTSDAVCKAIAAPDDPNRAAVLKKHIARIDDPRLRRAFAAAIDLEEESPPGSLKHHKPRNLWMGLRR